MNEELSFMKMTLANLTDNIAIDYSTIAIRSFYGIGYHQCAFGISGGTKLILKSLPHSLCRLQVRNLSIGNRKSFCYLLWNNDIRLTV